MYRRTFLSTLPGAGMFATRTRSSDGVFEQEQSARVRLPRAETFYGCIAADLDTFESDVAVVGVPYDLGHGTNPGTRLGPGAIRAASPPFPDDANRTAGLYDIDRDEHILQNVRVVDVGNVIAPPAQVEPTLDRISAVVATIIERRAMPVVLGGDHSITFPVLRGYAKAGQKVHIIHLDAHLDFAATADRVTGQISYRHGNHIRHAIDLPWVSGVTMIGLRGIRRAESVAEARKRGVHIVTTSNAIEMGPERVAASIPAADSYYVTIDIDVIDPSLAPGTGTPAPGGFTYFQLRDLLRAVASRGRVVGFDLTEVSPPNDFQDTTSRLAAHVVMEFLGAVMKRRARDNQR